MTMRLRTLNLIQLMRNHPNLYNKKHPDYRNPTKKAESWEEISEELNLDCDVVKTKWKNVRDAYVKYLKFMSGTPGSAKRFEKWPWAQYLDFLHDALELPNSRDASELNETCNSSNDTTHHQVEEIISIECVSESPPLKRRKTAVAEPMPAEEVNTFVVCEDYHPQNQQEKKIKFNFDRIDHLFLSYAETFKKLSPRTQILLKMEMAEMFGRAEIRELEGVTSTDPLK